MITKETLIKVTNRDNGTVGYTIPDLGNLHRNFRSGETKELTFEEILKLNNTPGGDYILQNFLLVQNEEAVKELQGSVEPEYYYTKTEVHELLLRGSCEQLIDALNFGPLGVIELIKDEAINLKIDSIDKRNIIKEKTGLDITKAIAINEEVEKDEPTPEKAERKASPISKRTSNRVTNRMSTPIETNGQ